ncbi:helix-turn-helix domain-containing protein [Actinokineospora bangkokensis]|uniref:HTH cro/C1-type domain-containing protein n=1 Tax=Actinokineospora bangkokensis TaxID=1193682 RepID=A0A1Q9LQY6_9PSEU|nr:helix-turn-helix transcriptional regulator [Actinokineospora bangkokensis]OLR94430.1 hypothetical protein BJP25_11780 [Actinokineospora bangkokensis]
MAERFGAALRAARRRSGLTQEELAHRAGLGVRTVRGLETGERATPRTDTVHRLADALGLAQAERTELLLSAGNPGADHEPEPAPEPPPVSALDRQLAEAADRLAHTVLVRWQREEEHRQVFAPVPLPVRWRAAAPGLSDSWDNIGSEPVDLVGRFAEVVRFYERVPSGRLVVLGRAGSGKSVLAVRFVLDRIGTRAAGEPVPVVFGLASWNPATTALRDWLTTRLLEDHPDLRAPGPDGTTLAAALVDTGRVLPVLDGFDEMPGGVHQAAVDSLNAARLPVVVTSRPDEYAAAVAARDVLAGSVAVELEDLKPDDLVEYLPRATRDERWTPVLDALRTPEGHTLAAVLTSPLMVGLARTVYDHKKGDPAELLDTRRFPTPAALEEHLLGSLLPSAYRYQPESARFHPEAAEHYLRSLARHLNRLGTRDLAWWRLGLSLPVWVRAAVVAAISCVVIGVGDLLGEAAVLSFTPRGAVFAAALGLAGGVVLGVLNAAIGRVGVEPTRVRLRVRRSAGRDRGRVAARAKLGFRAGAVLAVAYTVVRELAVLLTGQVVAGWPYVLFDATVFAVVLGSAAAAVVALLTWFEHPLDVGSAGSPADLLAADRRTVLVQLVVFGPLFAVVTPLLFLLVLSALEVPGLLPFELRVAPGFALLLGLVAGVTGSLAYLLCASAWGHWLLFARLYLPLVGRLPWAVGAFLEDACARGVLRRAGAVYQFRHARLQDHLAARPA